MIGPFRRVRDVVVVVVLLALPFFVLPTSVRDPRKVDGFGLLVLRVISPFQYAGTLMGREISSVVSAYFYLVDVKADNDRISHENVALRERVRRLEGLEVENRRLRRLLGLREQIGYEALTAQVIAREPSAEFRVATLLLDRPSSEVKPGWPVLADEGVVGTVLRAEEDRLEVQLAVDPAFAIDVVDERTGSRGIVRGISDIRRYAVKVEYMKRSDEVAIGDLLVTSGIGRRFGKGIPVGRVTAIRNRGFGEFQEVEAEPMVSFSRLEEVLVVPPTDAIKGSGLEGSPPAQPATSAGTSGRR